MGEMQELSRRLPAAIRDGEQRGDLYAATSLRMGVPNMLWLAEDRASDALQMAEEAISHWPTTPFLLQHYRRGVASAFRLGRKHGVFCLGCCWALMLVGFAAGVANLWWMAALTAIMAYENHAHALAAEEADELGCQGAEVA